MPQAIYCLNRALRLKTTVDCLFLKAQLMEEQGLLKKAADTLFSLLPKLGATEHGKRTETSSCLARIYFQLGEPQVCTVTKTRGLTYIHTHTTRTHEHTNVHAYTHTHTKEGRLP